MRAGRMRPVREHGHPPPSPLPPPSVASSVFPLPHREGGGIPKPRKQLCEPSWLQLHRMSGGRSHSHGVFRLTCHGKHAADTSPSDLVRTAKLRWRIERDYQDLKQEVGFGHYEGRGWRGFHHHTTLCIAAYAFLLAERVRLSPPDPGALPPVEVPALPDNHRPRGAASPR